MFNCLYISKYNKSISNYTHDVHHIHTAHTIYCPDRYCYTSHRPPRNSAMLISTSHPILHATAHNLLMTQTSHARSHHGTSQFRDSQNTELHLPLSFSLSFRILASPNTGRKERATCAFPGNNGLILFHILRYLCETTQDTGRTVEGQ